MTSEPTWNDMVGVRYSQNTLTAISPSQWGQAGCFSNECLINDGLVIFEAKNNNTKKMCGLSETNQDHDFTTIGYGICLDEDAFMFVIEQGYYRGGYGYYRSGDTFSIERVGSTIVYRKNDRIYHKSFNQSQAPLFIDTAFGSPGAALSGFRMVGTRQTVP